jgi:mRNA-degrading endonuclease RelE of RelBE toxin-antitoxin system
MRKRIEWTPQAQADVRRIDRQTALGLLEDLADYALSGHGDVQRLTDVAPPEMRLRLGDYRIRFYDHGDWILILRGDGTRTRSFMYIDDCIRGIEAIMNTEIREPINLGSSEMVTINQLVDIVEDIAGVRLKRHYGLDAPKGVMGRNSENTLIRKYLGWEPSIPLRVGLEKTYAWIYDQYMAREKVAVAQVDYSGFSRDPAGASPR